MVSGIESNSDLSRAVALIVKMQRVEYIDQLTRQEKVLVSDSSVLEDRDL